MLRFPFFKQLDTMDCGPASLKIICKYYGKSLSMKFIRDKCYITREGVSLLDISRAAEEIGLRTLSLKVSIEELEKKIPLPCIIHWNYSHFIVVYKITKNKVYVSDPQIGLVTYPKKEFNYHWKKNNEKGNILALDRKTEFAKIANVEASKNLSEYFNYLFAYKKYFAQIFLGIILTIALSLIFPVISQAIVDIGINTRDLTFIHVLLIASVVLTVSSVASNFMQSRLMLFISDKININMVSDFIHKLIHLPLPFFERKMTSDILARINDHGRIQNFVFESMLGSVSSILTFTVFAGILIFYDVYLFLIFSIGTLLYILWILLFLTKRRKLDYLFYDASVRNQSEILGLCEGIKEIKSNNLEQKKRWDWEKSRFEIYKLNVRLLNLDQVQEVGATLIEKLKNVLLTFVSAKAVIAGDMTLGMMLAVQYIIGQLNGPVGRLLGLIQSFQDAKISLERVNEVRFEEKKETSNVGIRTPIPANGSLMLHNVSYRYHNRQSFVLENIDLTIPSKKITAIVGESGSGKSTLMKLLLRLYEPTSGSIGISDIDFNSIDIYEWRRNSGAVLQDGVLFGTTILENIILDDEEVDPERLKYALRASNLNDYINNQPLKLYTVIGQGGTGMSGGQKQRILIARALYKVPEFLFLDEATNSLDAHNEKIISDNLIGFTKGKTTVIIAHRLSTVINAHQIVVMSKGKIVEVGSHEMLSLKKGAYYKLIENQLFVQDFN
jgi:ATP-binding cassette subfamily B protein